MHFLWFLGFGMFELARDVDLALRFEQCGRIWVATIKARTNRFPKDKLVCPNGCNKHIDGPIAKGGGAPLICDN